MLLPRVDPPVSPGQASSLPFETFSQSSHQKQMRKALRAMRGFPCYELRFEAGEDAAEFLARYAGLKSAEDKADEDKLSAALARLLWNCMSIHEDFKATFADGDLSDQAKLNDFYARAALKILVPNKT